MIDTAWWENPYRLLDPIDWMDDLPVSALYRLHLADRSVPRSVERSTFVHMLAAARRGLTHAEMHALSLEEEAVHVWGLEPRHVSSYVAEKRGTGIRQAQKLLRQAKIKSGSYSDAFDKPTPREQQKRGITSRDVERHMAAIPKACAGQGTPGCEGYAPPKRDLCWSCYKTYSGEPYPEWLKARIAQIRAEHRRTAWAELIESPLFEER